MEVSPPAAAAEDTPAPDVVAGGLALDDAAAAEDKSASPAGVATESKGLEAAPAAGDDAPAAEAKTEGGDADMRDVATDAATEGEKKKDETKANGAVMEDHSMKRI